MFSKRIPQLDAVRGIAVLAVILHNQARDFPTLRLARLTAPGWMGVDLFFVLSGLLITGILLDSKGSHGYFANFFARRCLRIWPLYAAVLIFMWIVVPLGRPSIGQDVFARSSPWWAYPLFLQNFLVPRVAHAVGPLAVTWSLAVEEQFYAAWPWIVRFSTRRQLTIVALTIVLLSPLARLLAASRGVEIYSNTFCRLDGLMAGALLALVVRSERFVATRFTPAARASLLIVAPLALAADMFFPQRWFVFSLSVAASTAFIYVAMFSAGTVSRVMTNRFLVYTGSVSYGLYLLHKIPFDLAKALAWERSWVALPVLVAVSYGVAFVSWRVLERPFLRLKRFFEADSLSVPATTKAFPEGD